jgi:hypothetical protein
MLQVPAQITTAASANIPQAKRKRQPPLCVLIESRTTGVMLQVSQPNAGEALSIPHKHRAPPDRSIERGPERSAFESLAQPEVTASGSHPTP